MKVALLGFAAVALLGGPAFGQAATVAAEPPDQASAQANPLDLNGARLGMTLAEWETLPHGVGPGSKVAPSCVSSAAQPSAAQHIRISGSQDDLVCSYAARYGQYIVPQSFPITPKVLALTPTYDFVGGRLSRIEFHASVDAFNDLDALFTASFGPPVRTLQDDLTMRRGLKFPRVRREWRTARDDLWIIDPSARPDELLVRYSALAAEPSLPQS